MSGVPRRAKAVPVSETRAVIQISRPLHTRLTELKNEQQQRLSRQVSFTEVIEQLLNQAGAA